MVDFRHEGEMYDVAILGSGLGGSALAAILARQGRRVLLLEKGAHPRFAVGEAMLPQSSMPPVHGWSDPEQLHLDFTPDKLMRFIGWGKTEAPAELRDRMFDFDVAVLGGMANDAHAPAPARTPREELAIAMA